MKKAQLAAISTMVISIFFTNFVFASTEYKQWLEEAYPENEPGAAMIVIKDNKVIFRNASGMADMELGVSLTPKNVFRLGSITKQFTAAGILLLEEQGKLNVGDNINIYLPDYPTQDHVIKIENLLSRTSGIFDSQNTPGYDTTVLKDVSTQELIEVFENHPMNFAPGEQYLYSNSGYVLLGAIIEKVTGQSYAEFIQAAIFDKLGMANSFYGGSKIILNRANGYQGEKDNYSNASYISMTHANAAGALLSSVDDMAIWSKSLFGGTLLSKSSLKKMTTDFMLNNGRHTGYGFGLAINKRYGERQIVHGGYINGFRTNTIWLPKQKVYVVILSNNLDKSPDVISTHMAFDAAGADYPKNAAINMDVDKLIEYQGVYRVNERITRSVMIEEGHLYTQLTGGRRWKIVAHDKDVFFYPGEFTHLVFRRDRSGNIFAMDRYTYLNGAENAKRAEREGSLP
jgi:CubicO group peptidase (beta-lactamase class C family)